MVNTATQLKKYKDLKAKINKDFKGKGAGYMGFTIDICYGGNKEVDLKRVSLGGIACKDGMSNDFLSMIREAIDGNIDFWQKQVLRDIQTLEESLKQ